MGIGRPWEVNRVESDSHYEWLASDEPRYAVRRKARQPTLRKSVPAQNAIHIKTLGRPLAIAQAQAAYLSEVLLPIKLDTKMLGPPNNSSPSGRRTWDSQPNEQSHWTKSSATTRKAVVQGKWPRS